VIQPETKYTKVDDSWIAYQVVGDGPIDVCFVGGFTSNIETIWDWPSFARIFERIASWSRLILFDPRGSGVSDPLPYDREPTWENLTQDLRSVLDAAGSRRAAILGQVDGALAAILFAATYPDRSSALVLWNGYARSTTAPDYPIGWAPEMQDSLFDVYDKIWGRIDMVSLVDPSRAEDAGYVRAMARYMRTSSSPGRALATMRYYQFVDARSTLPSVRVPTLVLASHNLFIGIEAGKYIAAHIPGARFVEVASKDLTLAAMPIEIVDEIEEFVTGSRRTVAADRVLATVLFTDIVGSTEKAANLGDRRWKELLASHDRTLRDEVQRQNGRLVNTIGDGMLATFDGPGRAIRCAHALGRALETLDIRIRAGLHTGEIELREGDDIGGIAVHIASRVMHEAGPGEVICSRTVKDLVAGSEFAFDDRGVCTLKGVPDQWQLYAVRQA